MANQPMAVAYWKQARENLDAEVYQGFKSLMEDYRHHRVSRVTIVDLVARARKILKGHKSLMLGLNAFLPERYRIILTEDEAAMQFINKVKTRFEDDGPSYETFSRILQMYVQEKKTIIEVYEEISRLFGSHNDLLAEFKNYFPDASTGDERSISPDIHERKIRLDLKHKITDEHAVEICLHKDSSQSSGVQTFSASDGDCNGLKSVQKSGNDVAFADVDATSNKYLGKSPKNHGLSKCRQITPSYRLLPVDLTVAKDKILNNSCECVAPGNGSGVGSSRKTAQNKMFLIEDIRFEVDMFLERLESTIKRANELLKKIKNNEVGEDPVLCLNKHFEDRNLMCIEKLYQELGLEVLELLRDNAPHVLPIILSRLIQEKKEWAQQKDGFNSKYADVLGRNLRRRIA